MCVIYSVKSPKANYKLCSVPSVTLYWRRGVKVSPRPGIIIILLAEFECAPRPDHAAITLQIICS